MKVVAPAPVEQPYVEQVVGAPGSSGEGNETEVGNVGV